MTVKHMNNAMRLLHTLIVAVLQSTKYHYIKMGRIMCGD